MMTSDRHLPGIDNLLHRVAMRRFKDISTDNSNDNHNNKKRMQWRNEGCRHAASAHDRIISAVHVRTNDFSRGHAASLFVMHSTAAVGEMKEHKKHLT